MASSFAHREPDRPAPADGESPEPPAAARDAEPATPKPATPTASTQTLATPSLANESEVDQRLLRAMADLDNMRKRFYREVAREREAERFRVAREWLPVVDDLDRAIEHARDDQQCAHMTGLRAIRDHALEVLARLGFPRFEDVGERFDPARHEAVSAVASDAEPGTILAVVRPGYGPPEVILRPAAVVVAAS